jgi:8-oxo-dGTP diphosphatase
MVMPAAAFSDAIIVAAAALVDGDGRVLVQRRPAGKPMQGLWEFPGGKVERGEAIEDALIRELSEELGIEVERACLAPATFASDRIGQRALILFLFACRRWRGDPVSLEGCELRWLRPVQLHALDMPPADKPLIAILEALI